MKGIFLRCTSLFMAALMFCGSAFATVPLTRGTQVPICLTSNLNSKTSTTPYAIVNNDVKNKNGIVLLSPAENLSKALNLFLPSCHGVKFIAPRLFGDIVSKA